ncbi:MAG: hypothetical protein HQ539_02265 [Parcubacteria group bacterium]|nr:hypothetical protein [Parcubacteria group bacterium]
MKQYKFQVGFTLVETMVGILILTTGLAMALQIFSVSFSVEKDNQLRTQAALLAQEKVESLYSQSYRDLAVGSVFESQLSPPFELFSRDTIVIYVDANLEDAVVDSGLKKIEVVVSWRAAFQIREKSITVARLVAEK